MRDLYADRGASASALKDAEAVEADEWNSDLIWWANQSHRNRIPSSRGARTQLCVGVLRGEFLPDFGEPAAQLWRL
ncbi:MAG: hypothetical protein IRY93_09975, partial [Chthoniobacterales bacterium]|nr:hypothetical protein [Chthoniobacterales bacterium]